MKPAAPDQRLDSAGAPTADSARAAVVDLQAVHVIAGEKTLLQDISFRADEARVGIVGRNGSGKTTLSRVLAGLIAPDQGEARVDGIDLSRDRKAALELVGVLFQNPDRQIIFPTVEEEIGFGLRQMGLTASEIVAEVTQTLARFGKSQWAKAPTHLLSQGQKQLLCLMAILAMKPRIILLDEPFSGLDIPTRMQLQRALDQAEAQLFHVSHDPQHLEHYDRILWIEGGRLRADGSPADILPEFTRQMTEWGASDDLSDLAS
ncbi:energy-coupling factor ABC transporter ATP-binding protein [Phaeobacter gallaeciensis]|uniref:energy-coupling factor ABC transporter ATP-binding protein n=1 Tax=Phaeobacter gallaeciensis TaxID=60890 RepID=UPI00237F2BCE|nr:ABC transporter ATP-binding protein [Phaeobacter gallaeciensis]MDE4192941.1 ABC transporter ATP-binding protein [Phaeobacter gallaeciensis]MDE4198559.1 ABC transporter ATP-binding protein [Phaeobacter gallaeciensis]MDE4202704.1 ABC transporter ATP-binding protein [Phaeobacter gallaeciensis]MDE4206000.1 ABC transporter ATP-binding protein [Phaeobacter gallaeciensis]MDE4214367.1 ABC transporter ATP-binding protein [Phaeobacter gallaeciensis]